MNERWVRRALVVDDHAVIRVFATQTLEAAGFAVATCADAVSALARLDDFDPDVLVTDIDLGARPTGVDLATIARGTAPHVAVVFLTNYPSVAAAPRGAEALGGAVFVDKGALSSARELTDAVESALGRRSPAVSNVAPAAPADTSLAGLTRTQLDVLSLVAAGCSNSEIAVRTATTQRAVERMLARIFDRLGLSNDPTANPRVLAATRYARAFGPPGAVTARGDER